MYRRREKNFARCCERLRKEWSECLCTATMTQTEKFVIAPRIAAFLSFDCQQKRQQRCWNSVGSGTGGVVLDSSAKSSILNAETTLEATDSDPRPELRICQACATM